MKKLVIIQTAVPDYRNLFFERIKETLGDKFELYAGNEGFETTVKTKSNIKKDLKNHFLFGRRFLFQTRIWHLLFKNNTLVLAMNPRIFSNWIFLIIRKILRKETVLWGHAWPRNGKNSPSDWLRNVMRSLSSKIIVYTNQQREELQQKMPNKNILAAPNAVYKTENMKAEINTNQYSLIYVGRLVASKKVFFMVKAFHRTLHLLPKETKLFIVGDGEEKNKLIDYVKQHELEDSVLMLGHINDYLTLKELYDQSLFSISPGYVGLSITQSFSFGVPMLVSKNENHSPEIEAVIENENALFFETDSERNFGIVLNDIYKNSDFWKQKRLQIVDFCKKSYSTEAMAQVFINLLQ